MEFRELGKSGIKVSAIGIGTWQWGSREWGWGRLYGKKDLLDAFKKALEVGINFIDTAEIYGNGRSEQIISEAIRGYREQVIIATKVSPLNLSYGRLLRAANRSLQRLGVDVIDLYQVHWPNPLVPISRTMRAMKKLVQDGKVRCVGISNFGLERMKSVHASLAPLELASNQVRYNLLDRRIEADVLPYARKEKVSIIAYSPLAQALLTGKYTARNRPSSLVQRINFRFSPGNLTRLTDISRVLSETAQTHGKTPSQVALNWLIRDEDVIAIPGVKGSQHVIDNAGAADWKLTDAEIQRMDRVSTEVQFSRLSALPNYLRVLMGR